MTGGIQAAWSGEWVTGGGRCTHLAEAEVTELDDGDAAVEADQDLNEAAGRSMQQSGSVSEANQRA